MALLMTEVTRAYSLTSGSLDPDRASSKSVKVAPAMVPERPLASSTNKVNVPGTKLQSGTEKSGFKGRGDGLVSVTTSPGFSGIPDGSEPSSGTKERLITSSATVSFCRFPDGAAAGVPTGPART